MKTVTERVHLRSHCEAVDAIQVCFFFSAHDLQVRREIVENLSLKILANLITLFFAISYLSI